MKRLKCFFANVFNAMKRWVYLDPLETRGHKGPQEPISVDVDIDTSSARKRAEAAGRAWLEEASRRHKISAEQLANQHLYTTEEVPNVYTIDFHGDKKLEKKLRLKNFFGDEYLQLTIGPDNRSHKDKVRETLYVRKGKGNDYYFIGTDKRARIYSGDMVEPLRTETAIAKAKRKEDELIASQSGLLAVLGEGGVDLSVLGETELPDVGPEVGRVDSPEKVKKAKQKEVAKRLKKKVRDLLKKQGATEEELFAFDQAYRKPGPDIKKIFTAHRELKSRDRGSWAQIHNFLIEEGGDYYSKAYVNAYKRKFKKDPEAIQTEELPPVASAEDESMGLTPVDLITGQPVEEPLPEPELVAIPDELDSLNDEESISLYLTDLNDRWEAAKHELENPHFMGDVVQAEQELAALEEEEEVEGESTEAMEARKRALREQLAQAEARVEQEENEARERMTRLEKRIALAEAKLDTLQEEGIALAEAEIQADEEAALAAEEEAAEAERLAYEKEEAEAQAALAAEAEEVDEALVAQATAQAADKLASEPTDDAEEAAEIARAEADIYNEPLPAPNFEELGNKEQEAFYKAFQEEHPEITDEEFFIDPEVQRLIRNYIIECTKMEEGSMEDAETWKKAIRQYDARAEKRKSVVAKK